MQLCLQILSCHKKITYYMSQIQSYTLHLVFVDTYYLLSLPCLICRLVIIKTCCTYFDSSFLIFAIYGFIFITHFWVLHLYYHYSLQQAAKFYFSWGGSLKSRVPYTLSLGEHLDFRMRWEARVNTRTEITISSKV